MAIATARRWAATAATSPETSFFGWDRNSLTLDAAWLIVQREAQKLPVEYRPVLPDAGLRRAMLRAMVGAKRLEFRRVRLPEWRRQADARRLDAMMLTREDVTKLVRAGREEAERAVATRIVQARLEVTTPPQLFLGLANRFELMVRSRKRRGLLD